MNPFQELLQALIDLIKAFFGPILAQFGLDIEDLFND